MNYICSVGLWCFLHPIQENRCCQLLGYAEQLHVRARLSALHVNSIRLYVWQELFKICMANMVPIGIRVRQVGLRRLLRR